MALEQLHNMFTQKKRAFQKIYETIMKRHLELCVDLKDFRTAKDGLHQYRTMTQLVSYIERVTFTKNINSSL